MSKSAFGVEHTEISKSRTKVMGRIAQIAERNPKALAPSRNPASVGSYARYSAKRFGSGGKGFGYGSQNGVPRAKPGQTINWSRQTKRRPLENQ